ncbi:hypothetical protein K439DRAFT_1634075 [Ramaria rubella]|nr:hypothetical protein K439DRAFT_1634075 [Ramaria rubella]
MVRLDNNYRWTYTITTYTHQVSLASLDSPTNPSPAPGPIPPIPFPFRPAEPSTATPDRCVNPRVELSNRSSSSSAATCLQREAMTHSYSSAG